MTQIDRLRFVVNKATALLMLGEESGWLEAAQVPEEAPTPSAGMDITRAHLNFGDAAIWWGRYKEARRRLAKALELAETHQLIHLRHLILSSRVHLDWLNGEWDGLAERASELADDEDISPMARVEGAIVAGMLHLAAGAPSEAEEQFQSGLSRAQQLGHLEFFMMASAGLAKLRLVSGNVGDALRVSSLAADLLTAKGIWVTATDLAPAHVSALMASGATEDSQCFVTAFASGLRGRNVPAPKAALSLCRALMAEGRGEYRSAAALFASAADSWQELSRPYDALQAQEREAACLLAEGEATTALDLLADVLRGASRLGAANHARRASLVLREHGRDMRPVRRGGSRGYGSQLSPRELEVVRLAATGRTNRQIAGPVPLTQDCGDAAQLRHAQAPGAIPYCPGGGVHRHRGRLKWPPTRPSGGLIGGSVGANPHLDLGSPPGQRTVTCPPTYGHLPDSG